MKLFDTVQHGESLSKKILPVKWLMRLDFGMTDGGQRFEHFKISPYHAKNDGALPPIRTHSLPHAG